MAILRLTKETVARIFMVKFRNFIFTINNPSDEVNMFWQSLVRLSDFREEKHVRYVVFQTERGDGGTIHLQGYVELDTQMRLPMVRRTFGEGHYEVRKGSQATMVAYVTKEDTRMEGAASGEGGTPKKLGKDTMQVVSKELKEGKTCQELMHDYPVQFIMHGPQIRSYAMQLKGRRSTAPEVEIYFGKTGTGKSAMAQQKYPDAYWIPNPRKGGWWWPNYCGEEVVIFDEFRHQLSLDTMLKWLDRYPFDIQEKGNNMNFVSKKIVITTNIHPLQWYPNTLWDVKEPLRRRFKDFCKLLVFDDESTWDNPITENEAFPIAGQDEFSFAQ